MAHRILDELPDEQDVQRPSTPFEEAKVKLHAQLVASLDLPSLQGIPRRRLEGQLRQTLEGMVRAQPLPITGAEQEQLVEDILDEVLGYGPIERLLHDPTISDILINGPHQVFVERRGRLEEAEIQFRDEEHLLHVINRIVSAVGRRVDEATPMVDARLRDGSRFNAIIAPVALEGPVVSIRRFGANPIRRDDLIALGTLPEVIMNLLAACVHSRLNILVSGGTGSGKTTFLNVLSSFIPVTDRVVTIEDAAELRLQQKHVVRLETRPPNLEGEGAISARALVRNALRMRPDRIIVGEIRGDECIDMLQAMNTGHEGSISTIHANSPRHALGRLQTMVGLGLGNMPSTAIREMISDALNIIVQIARLSDGRRRIVSITELTGMESGVISTQEIFRFRQQTIDADGNVHGTFEATGIRPAFARRLEAHGVEIDARAFQYRADV